MARFHVKQRLAICAALALGAFCAPAQAQKIYRCTGAGGSVTISDMPCTSAQGGEVSVKPASGATKQPRLDAPNDSQAKGATDKREAEFEAMLSPECRRARRAYLAKESEKGGTDELMKVGNPIGKAWDACMPAAGEALGKLHAKERERAKTENGKRSEQDLIAQKKHECDTKQKVLAERRPRLAQLNESDRTAFRVLEQDVAVRCS